MDFTTALQTFMDYVQQHSDQRMAEQFPSLPLPQFSVSIGKKNAKVITRSPSGDGGSVFCFIRIADGAVLKAASWKAPAKHPRGTIYTDDPSQYGVSDYGANYL